MSLILPYNEEIATSEGCYITPEGEFILTYGNHTGYTFDHFRNNPEMFKYQFNIIKGVDIARYPIQLKNWDRLRTIRGSRIESASKVPNIRFFNWQLMDWPVISFDNLKYNPEKDTFEIVDSESEEKELNLEYGREILQIKSKVKKKDRSRYFL